MQEQRSLGLDVGERRIGVALSDPSGRLASALTTLQARPQAEALTRIERLVAEHGVYEVVVGLPLTLRGEVGPQAEVVQRFAEALGERLTLPIHLFDERLTTSAAEQLLRDLGVKPEKRRQQVDQVAAAIILQDFLDQRQRQGEDLWKHPH
ncbi:Holliday junction resolvase RuvX [Candidatus Viridilinea mediisalina]|uniref:Putative pre-16S rRNA nuclease n=1 Tax=Candidatus Viridilinea mediisalina TaxID=2024553 RepID=A0A2A6RIL6_9CHLR|nr:Holliday junction resolvase RuvX [Candidatus Viridilinea mediisalina]PDW02725.1 Holliday junction resolvase RuvX [Candidatus Viridilinea mediisalina]